MGTSQAFAGEQGQIRKGEGVGSQKTHLLLHCRAMVVDLASLSQNRSDMRALRASVSGLTGFH